MKAVAIAVVTAALWSLQGAASASVYAGHSGWFWGNPLPQGNTLRAVAFVGNRGYAVGDFGTVMRSDDGGTNWIGITTATTAALQVVEVIAPDTIVVGGGCVAQRSDDAGRSFVSLPWTPAGSACRAQVESLAFPSSAIGYLLLSDGSVLRTRDGGNSWVARTAIPGTPATSPGSKTRPTEIQFPSQDVGFAATQAGMLYRTTDGGISWSPVAESTQHLDSISFPDALTGYAAGGASVLKTEDGGLTWTQQGVVQPPASIHWIRCADALRCVAVTARGDQLLRTEDGGSTWTSISPSTRPLLAATYAGGGSMVAVGEAGATVASADGGHNFAMVGDNLPGRFTHLRATSGATAYAWGRAGALARSTDGGETWSALASPSAANLVDVTFPTATRGYALDADGGLTLTDDGGDSWHLLDIGTYLKPRAVIAPDASRVLLIGPRGMQRSRSGGFAFTRVRQNVVAKEPLNAGGTTAGLAFAYGRRALVVSEDAGENWQAATVPTQGKGLAKVDFVSNSIAYALTRNGRVWKTIDRGRDWHELSAIGTEKSTDLAFSDPQNGYVAVSQFAEEPNGYVMRTSDGGNTWRPQLVDRTRIRPGALEAPGPLSGFAISDVDHLLATETGGDVGEPSKIVLSVHRRRPGQPGVVAVSGQLTPPHGGEKVWVSRREKDRHWELRDVRVSSTGRFTVFSLVTRPTQFVAQWSGDDTRAGAGSPVLTIRVREKPPRRNAKPPAPRPRR